MAVLPEIYIKCKHASNNVRYSQLLLFCSNLNVKCHYSIKCACTILPGDLIWYKDIVLPVKEIPLWTSYLRNAIPLTGKMVYLYWIGSAFFRSIFPNQWKHTYIWDWNKHWLLAPLVTNSARSVPDNKIHGTNMGPTWVLSASNWPHVGPMNPAIRGARCSFMTCTIHGTAWNPAFLTCIADFCCIFQCDIFVQCLSALNAGMGCCFLLNLSPGLVLLRSCLNFRLDSVMGL